MRRLLLAATAFLLAAAIVEAQSLKGVRKEFAEVGEELIPATVIVRGSGAAEGLTGSSGVIVHEDGYVLSDADATLVNFEKDEKGEIKRDEKGIPTKKIHGVNATVRLPAPDHRVFRAVAVHRDAETDTTLLKITDKIKGDLPVVPIGTSDRLRVGAFVLTAGVIFGHKESEPSLSLGIVSGLVGREGRVGGRFETIYTSATVVRGSNGGPMVDKEGRLVGIISTFDTDPASPYRALGMVTPIDKIRPRYEGKEGYEKVFPDPEAIKPRAREAGILEDAFAIAARRARASLVSIEVEREEDAKAEKIVRPFGQRTKEGKQVEIPVARYAGPFTGLVVSKDGLVLTCTENLWAFGKIKKVTVHLADGRKLEAKLLGRDRYRNLGLLKVEAKDLVPLPRASKAELIVGRLALALGHPFGARGGEAPLMTFGLVGGLGRVDERKQAIHTDAGLNEGLVGGPLLSIDGKLLGVTILERPEYYGRNSGIGFAIPVHVIEEILPDLRAGRTLEPGFLGVRWRGKRDTGEILVAEVVPEGPAEKAGVKPGDVLMEMDGRGYLITDAEAFGKHIGEGKPGQVVKLKVKRNGELKDLRVTLGSPPD